MIEYTPPSHQLISHELAELREAEAMEQEFRDYMERKQRPKVTDPFAGQGQRIQPLIMSQRDYNDIVEWGKSIEEKEARKEKMRIGKFLSKQQIATTTCRPTGPSGGTSRGTMKPLSARAIKRRKKAEEGKCR